ncbi:MAG: hypothetical protein GF341_07925, partial [candidate division Zixibacteria bacterium]|nr:hypothetical protein [candidate division Zixibacteria bacterium]
MSRMHLGVIRMCCLLVLLIASCSYDSDNASTTGDTTDSASVEALSGATVHHGIDVSYHSGGVDWATVAQQGFTFAFVKATEGDDLKDPSFAEHWQELKAHGIVRGAYHFYVTEDNPDTQAQLFTSVVTLEQGDLAPVVDIELIGHNTQPGLVERFRRFVTLIEDHYDTKPIIYTAPNFWNQHMSDEFAEYPLWVAEYGVDAPTIPNGWETWHLWQWQGDTTVTGVEKGADVSRVNPDLPNLNELAV